MPEPQADPHLPMVKRTAQYALIAGAVIALLKFLIFRMTNSVAVLSDGLESLINIVAAGVMLYSIWYSNRPADREHPYGHGKIEFMAVGLEGWLILIAGVVIAYEAVRRLFAGAELTLGFGLWLLGAVAVLDAVLAGYVWHAGRKYDNAVLKADGKHLWTDVASTVAVLAGLILVRWTGYTWLDPIVAILVAGAILAVSWRLLWHSFHGLMDRADPHDQQVIREILEDEIAQGRIRGYHKLRHRHTGPFHWVDMHLQIDPDMSISEGHELASRVEGRIERRLGQANATAHVEPHEPERHPSDARTPPSSPPAPPAVTADHARAGSGRDESSAQAEPLESQLGRRPTEESAAAQPEPSGSEEPAPPPPSPPADRPELADQRDPDEDEPEPPSPRR